MTALPPTPHPTTAAARNALLALRTEIAKAVVGQDAVVSGLVIALLCRGHVLLEGVPGVAKTLLVRTLAAALQLDFKRVQFTPDLMPGDITGSLVYDARTAEFEFRSGPVFTNLLLADEINRTPPKTQAALLEAMEERQVSVDGEPRPLPDPFIVAATQNPIEYEGTYQLPEAQLDRFLLKLNVPLPPRDQEIAILSRHAHGFDPRDLSGGPARRRPRRPGRRPRGGAPGAGRRRGARLHRRHRRRHPAVAVAAARRLAARRDRTAGHRAVVGLAVGPQLRHARRRQGDGPARRCGTGSRCGPRPNSRAPPPTASSTASSPRSRCRASDPHRPRRTGRTARACCRSASRPGPQRRSSSCSACCSLARRASTSRWPRAPRGLTLQPARRQRGAARRAGRRRRWSSRTPGAARSAAWSATPGHRRRGREPRTARRWTSLRDNAVRVDHDAAPDPARRPAVGAGDGALGRAAGAGRPAELAPGAVAGPDPAAVPVPQAPAVAAGQAARTRRHDPRADPRPGHRVRLAARVRRRRRRPLDRLAGHRAAGRRRGADLAAGARPPGRHRARHRPDVGGPGRRRPHRGRPERLAAAGLVDGRRTAVGGVGLPRRRPRRLHRPRPGRRGPAVYNASRTELLRPARRGDGAAAARAGRVRRRGDGRHGPAPRPATRAGGAADRPERRRRSTRD